MNFISQCLRTGNWTYVPSVSPYSRDAWWYMSYPPVQTRTWVNSQDFFYFVGQGRGTLANSNLDLRTGDIVQADWPDLTGKKDGVLDHTMLVTISDSRDIYLTYHTRDRKDRSFSDILDENTHNGVAPTFYFWSIRRVVN